MSQNQTLQHKRTTIAGNQPTTSQIATGELALNLADYSIYTNNGTSIVELATDLIKAPTEPSPAEEGDLWYNTTDDTINLYNGFIWSPLVYQGKQILPANTTFSTAPSSGSGTSASPYLFNIKPATPGQKFLVTKVTITGLSPNQWVPIQDSNQASNDGKFTVSNNLADAGGTLRFNIVFNDLPTSLPGASIVSQFEVGTQSMYIDITVTMASVFPQAVTFPTNTLSATTLWSSPNDTLTATGDIQISIDGVTYTQGPIAITTGATLYTKWAGTPGSGIGIDSPHDSVITGTIVSIGGGDTVASLSIDKTPNVIVFTPATGAGLSTSVDSNTVTVSGVNSYLYLTSSNVVSASIAGVAFATVPSSGTSQYLINGQTLQLRQTSSATVSTTTTATVAVGVGSTSFSVTTVAPGTINTPTIVSPVNGSTGITPTSVITSSAYAVTGIVGAHLNTDWEIYSNAALTGSPVASSLASTTNLTTWTPTGLGYTTQYWARVRYRSAGNPTVVSSWSPTVTWVTGVQPGLTWTRRTSPLSTAYSINDMVWNGTQYVGVCSSGYVITSPNGISWTLRYGLSNTAWSSSNAIAIVWNGTQFLVVGDSGKVATSADGITWAYRGTTLSGGTIYAVAWSVQQSQYVACGVLGRIATSPDGITWTNRTGLSTTAWGTAGVKAIVWSGTQYVVGGDASKIATSPDGITWTNRTQLSTTTWGNAPVNAIVWSGTQYMVGGGIDPGRDVPVIATSPDGITWTYQPGLAAINWGDETARVEYVFSLIWNGTQFMAGGDERVSTSYDGVTWKLITTFDGTFASGEDVLAMAWNGTQYVVGLSNGMIGTSP